MAYRGYKCIGCHRDKLLQNDKHDRFQSCIASVVVRFVALWIHEHIDTFCRIWIYYEMADQRGWIIHVRIIVYVPAVTKLGPITAIFSLIQKDLLRRW